MHSSIDLRCAPGRFVEVTLDDPIRTTEGRMLIEEALLEGRLGRLFPTLKGFAYHPHDERWNESRIVERLHNLLKKLFGDDYTVSFGRS